MTVCGNQSAETILNITQLCAVSEKIEEFQRESFFRRNLEVASSAWPNSVTAGLQSLAVVMFKPESIVGRRIEPALKYLRERGFEPVAWRRVRLNNLSINSMWRFQWNVATLDRLDLAEESFCAGDSLLVFLRDDSPIEALPATARLRELKGPSQLGLQIPGQLRHTLSTPNRTMSMLHAPDEPIDIVRELGILFSSEDAAGIYTEVKHNWSCDRTASMTEEIHRLYNEMGSNSLDWSESLDRFGDLAPSSESVEELSRFRRASVTLGSESGNSRVWPRIKEILSTTPSLEPWDRLLIGTSLISHDNPISTCTIDSDGVAEWRGGLGSILPVGQRGKYAFEGQKNLATR